MKSMQALILVLGLGIAGALFNWAYLRQKSADLEMVPFIGIKTGVTVNAGDKLTEEHLAPVAIPAENVGNLRDFAYEWKSLATVVGRPVHRTLTGGSLLLQEDLKTPPPKLTTTENLPPGEEEYFVGVPVDSRTFVPSLVAPGDQVKFVFSLGDVPTPAPSPGESSGGEEENPEGPKPIPSTGSQIARRNVPKILGPFEVRSVGNRLSSSEVWRAWGKQSINENVLIIAVRLKNGQLDPKVQELMGLLQATNYRNVGVLWNPRESKSK